MESLTWFLTFAALAGWVGAGIALLRHPPKRVGPLELPRPRLLWAAATLAALLAGVWGPQLWSTSQSRYVDDPDLGPPVTTSATVIRTPFAVQTVTSEADHADRVIRTEDRLTLQLPVVLLVFLGFAAALTRRRKHERSDEGSRSGRAALVLLLLAAAGCGDGNTPAGADGSRPSRVLSQATWDTLAHVELAPEDTLLFGANHLTAAEEGFWILDRVGYRVAHFGWDGEFRWYAGRRGAGPGELANPRMVDVDRQGRVWVLDLANHRASAYGPGGVPAGEISLQPLDGVLHTFAISESGERVFGLIIADRLHPVSVDALGRVERGDPIEVPDAEGSFGIAFQGVATGAGGNDTWVYAFTSGDGLFRFHGVDRWGSRMLYPEPIPFPGMVVREETEGDRTTTVRQLTEPNFSAGEVAVTGERILIRFHGETEEAGRLLDVYELETGRYLESFLLPTRGRMAAWGDRVVLVRHDPAPEVLVLERIG